MIQKHLTILITKIEGQSFLTTRTTCAKFQLLKSELH